MKKICTASKDAASLRTARPASRHSALADRSGTAGVSAYALATRDKRKTLQLKPRPAAVCLSDDALMAEFLSVLPPARKKAFLNQVRLR